jgi:NADH dehydrogenase
MQLTPATANPATASPAERVEGVLVVGGGYAGLHAATAVRRSGLPVTVLDRTGRHDFVTRLAAVAAGTAPVEDAAQPLRSFVDQVIVGTATTIADGSVTLSTGHLVTADAVVVTTGSAASRPPIDGIELALSLRTADDALTLRARVARASSVVIIGGGATGVQLAAALAVAHPSLAVHLVEATPRLLAGMSGAIGSGAARILRNRNVELHLGAGVDRITAHGAVVEGTLLEGLVIWAGGFTAPARPYGLPVSTGGRILVDEALRVHGTQRTFAAGDIAAHHDRNEEPLPMSAQIAVQAGTAAGRNAAATVRGEAVDAVDLRSLGWVLDLGGRRGLARLGPVHLTAPGTDLIPPLVHEAIDLKNLVEIGGFPALRYASASVRALVPWPITHGTERRWAAVP